MELMPGYKRSEVGVIPDGWEVKPLGEAVDFLDGRRRPVKDSDRAKMRGDIPYYGASGIVDYVNDFLFDEELILLGEDGENILSRNCRLAFKISGKTWVNNHAHVLRPKPGMILDYLVEFLESQDYDQYNTGTAQPKLNKMVCSGIPVLCPPPHEQHAIAQALSDVDALIATLDQMITKKRDLKQAAMQQLLTGKTRLPGFSGEWEVKRLDELAFLYQPQTISAQLFTEAGFPVYGANGVVGFYHSSNHKTWQVTVTCRGSTCGTVNRTVDECWITGNAMVLNCDSSQSLNKDFLYYLMLAQDLSDCITGTGQPQIVRAPLSAFKVCLPINSDEQATIANTLSDMDAELIALESRRNKTRNIKQAMMQELLTGKTRLV